MRMIRSTIWNAIAQGTPTGAADAFFYFSNTWSDAYEEQGLTTRVASAETIEIYLVDTGTPVGGSTVTTANRNTAGTLIPDATIESGVDITGLVQGTLVETIQKANTSSEFLEFDKGIVLEPGGVMTFYVITGAVLVDVNVLQLFLEYEFQGNFDHENNL